MELQAPEEFGKSTSRIHQHFVAPLQEESKLVIEAAKSLTKACRPILEHGPNPAANKEVEEHLITIGKVR